MGQERDAGWSEGHGNPMAVYGITLVPSSLDNGNLGGSKLSGVLLLQGDLG